MSKWEMVKLSDIFTLQMGKTPSRDNPSYWNGTHKWVSIADLGKAGKYICDTKENITDSAVSETGIKLTPKGTVVMSFKLSIGKTAITLEDIFTNEAIMAFIDRKTYLFDIDYIYHLFSGKDWNEGTNKAVMGNTLNKATLSQITIPLPPLEIQHQIASNLDKVTRLIDLCNSILDRLDLLVKSRFVEMFGEPETNPLGWERVKLEDVCASIVRGPFGSALKKEFFVQPDETTYKVYEQKHAIQKSATIGTYYITEEKYNELKRFECFAGDILMSCSGTMGELYQLPDDCERGVINQALCKFTLNDKIIPVVFLVYMKQTIWNLETKGSGIQNIAAVSYVKDMPINLPPLKVQKQFAAFVEQTDKSKLAVKKVLEKAETLKKALMQEYFG